MLDATGEPAGPVTVLPPEALNLREVDHRVANSLQLISTLLSLQARQATEATVKDALGVAAHRVGAVGAIHRQLHQSGARRSIDIARYLFDLAGTIEQGFGGGVGRKRISAHVQRQLVSPDFASMVGILVTELVINACKHAYAPDERGDVDICLFFPSGTGFAMEVRDFGCGKAGPRGAATRAGLGTTIIEAMCRRLDARFACFSCDEGTRCRVEGTFFA